MTQLDEKYYFKKIKTDRGSGLLMHISSLPGPYGIGSMGKSAEDFVNFLEAAGQSYWQMLPLGPTSFGDSPYQSFSIYAGNPYFIDLDILAEKGLLKSCELEEVKKIYEKCTDVDYGLVYSERFQTLRKAFSRFKEGDDYREFLKENDSVWLRDYALFMALKAHHGNGSWLDWEDRYKRRDTDALEKFEIENKNDMDFQKFMQFEFFQQWNALKAKINAKGIRTIGDIPIYVAEDSADVWVNPELFELGEDLRPLFVGGCPPDAFSDDGQLWGNPVYNWERHKETGYKWWIERIGRTRSVFDIIRIDHFRGFESYWRIPAGDTTARRGSWCTGPAIELFDAIKDALGEVSIIAEDLGYMTEEVYKFRLATGFPGMKILQFAFEYTASSDYLPHNMDENSVVYTGTHDNDTIMGWLSSVRGDEFELAREYLNLTEEETYTWGLIRGAMTSVARLAIFQTQDLLYLDNSARMNNPGTLGGNWAWRMRENALSPEIADRLKELTRISGRLRKH